jgi:hypothetical protein
MRESGDRQSDLYFITKLFLVDYFYSILSKLRVACKVLPETIFKLVFQTWIEVKIILNSTLSTKVK